MAGIGIKTAAQILLSSGDGSDFAPSGNLSADAGIAPVTRESGSSIRASSYPEEETSN
ncbi:transposase [Corynebacterium amycolatum]